MTQQETFEKVVKIINPYVKNPTALANVSPDTNILDDLKVNSARLVDIVLAFEDEFQIQIADEDADKVDTIRDAVELIMAKLLTTTH